MFILRQKYLRFSHDFQKLAFDRLEHTDHALNLIADSSFPGSLGLIDIKKNLRVALTPRFVDITKEPDFDSLSVVVVVHCSLARLDLLSEVIYGYKEYP